ncbi:hypothetical protein SAMN05216293_0785 [Flagellimonas taeanensis]|uniref:Uncharacterized protein n=1 Tax=Flagellimonas taeanensis TaxID=1005926 RepID=A0A1M6RJ52_9FLAO|nr:hypothetical protein SAMN05216293_0785 [Allomuricauda taeanensis]
MASALTIIYVVKPSVPDVKSFINVIFAVLKKQQGNKPQPLGWRRPSEISYGVHYPTCLFY